MTSQPNGRAAHAARPSNSSLRWTEGLRRRPCIVDVLLIPVRDYSCTGHRSRHFRCARRASYGPH